MSRDAALPPATTRARQRLGVGLLALTLLTVLLVAAGAAVAVRAPLVLLTGSLLPGYPLVARLPVDLPTLLALDVCASLAIDGALTFLLVQLHFWHPLGLGLVLASAAVGGALMALGALQDAARDEQL